jgi:hypothetical protein
VIQFEPTISLGALLQAVLFVGTVAVAYSRFVARMIKLETKVNLMWSAMSRKWGKAFDDDEKFFGS